MTLSIQHWGKGSTRAMGIAVLAASILNGCGASQSPRASPATAVGAASPQVQQQVTNLAIALTIVAAHTAAAGVAQTITAQAAITSTALTK
jgi:hypothetical protein